MAITAESIRLIDLKKANDISFAHRHANCIVLSKDNKIILQERDHNWRTFPDCLSLFGGHIKPNEAPIQTLVRELKEELGAEVNPTDVVFIGAIAEKLTNYSELIYIYFWHDKRGTITGCYECKAKYYNNVLEALAHPKIMDYVVWSLKKCQKQKLLK